MEAFAWLLQGVSAVGNVLMMLMFVYHVYLSVFGFRKTGRTYAEQSPQTRFLILVPAHNEETVIADMVVNLQKLDYPKELYDFYIIADNCADATASIARGLGAQVIETRKESEDEPTGKPLALKKALLALGNYEERYDLLMIFDADNLMDQTILREVNSQYISEDKPEIIQCYLGTKNPTGFVPMFDHMSFAISNRFMNQAKYNLGLNAAVGGTGFAVQTSYLASRGGWTTESLTEDFEMQMDVALRGGRILWNHNVRIYDEKPTNMIASFHQRVRWAQGRWFVTFRNTPRLFREWIGKKISFAEMLSLLTHMFSMIIPILAILSVISSLVTMLVPLTYSDALAAAISAAQVAAKAGKTSSNLLGQLLTGSLSVLMVGYSFFVLFLWADRVDNGNKIRLREVPLILVSYAINLLNVSAAQVVGLFKFRQQNKWVKTSHKISERQRVATLTGTVKS